ncbi:MAG: type IV pilus assembly protein PilM [Kiritimatiellae bacterium]|nr:type IV pilus assembly protein PilM [Kiritimatiellia bacterium]
MARILTLNIGAAKAVLAEYQVRGKTGLTLTRYATSDIVGMSAEAPQVALVPAIQEAMKTSGIKPGPLLLALNGQMVFPRFAKFPPADAEKFDELVHYEVEQNIPFPIDEVVCDHQLLGETAEGDQAAMIVAAKVDQVSLVTNAVSAAGLLPYVVDVGPMAVTNALKNAYPDLEGSVMVLDVGAKTTSLIIIEDEKIYLRAIPVAGNAITKELSQTFGCSPEEAEQLKKERGYVSLGGVTEDEDEVADRASKTIRAVLTRLHAEINRSINFYRSQQGGTSPTRVFLTGGSVRLPQIDDFFRETLKVEVEFLNPFGEVQVDSSVDQTALESDVFELVESVGLALRWTKRAAMNINLMPPALVAKMRLIKRIPFLAVGAVALLLALIVGIFAENKAAAVARAQDDFVRQKNAAFAKYEKELIQAVKAGGVQLRKTDEFQQLLASRALAVQRIEAVRRSLLPNMWITGWEEEKGMQKVTIRGWQDSLTAAEKIYADANNGKKVTAAELVQATLKKSDQVVSETVKIVATRDVNGRACLVEFAIAFKPAPLKSIAEAGKPSAPKKADAKGKGAAAKQAGGKNQ